MTSSVMTEVGKGVGVGSGVGVGLGVRVAVGVRVGVAVGVAVAVADGVQVSVGVGVGVAVGMVGVGVGLPVGVLEGGSVASAALQGAACSWPAAAKTTAPSSTKKASHASPARLRSRPRPSRVKESEPLSPFTI